MKKDFKEITIGKVHYFFKIHDIMIFSDTPSYNTLLRISAKSEFLSFCSNHSTFHSEELKNFIKDTDTIYKELKGETKIVSVEEDIHIHIKALQQGYIEISGKVRDYSSDNTCTFRLKFDQTFLSKKFKLIEA